MKKKVTNEVQSLDAQIQAEQKTRENFERQLAISTTARDEARARKDAISYEALKTDNPEAMQQLEELESTISKTGERVDSITSAIGECERRLLRLKERKSAAILEGKKQELKRHEGLLIADCRVMEEALAQLSTVKAKVDERLRAMDRVASEAGLNYSPRRLIGKNVAHVFGVRLEMTGYVAKSIRETFSKPIDKIIETVLQKGSIEQEQVAVNE